MLRYISGRAPGRWLAGLACIAILASAPRGVPVDPVETGWSGAGTSLALPAPAGSSGVEFPEGFEGGADDRSSIVDHAPTARASAGACRAVTCPWWSAAALERAGHPAVLPNAPPPSLVRLV